MDQMCAFKANGIGFTVPEHKLDCPMLFVGFEDHFSLEPVGHLLRDVDNTLIIQVLSLFDFLLKLRDSSFVQDIKAWLTHVVYKG